MLHRQQGLTNRAACYANQQYASCLLTDTRDQITERILDYRHFLQTTNDSFCYVLLSNRISYRSIRLICVPVVHRSALKTHKAKLKSRQKAKQRNETYNMQNTRIKKRNKHKNKRRNDVE